MTYLNEEWRDIEGYEGLYQVSNYGRVRSFHRGDSLLLLNTDRYGYPLAGLCKNGKRVSAKVHRLVAKAFIDNPNNSPCVNHKDENPLNNHIDNLEWCTQAYNIEYSLAKHYEVLTPDGFLLDVFNLTKYSKEMSLNHRHMHSVARGDRNHHKGYKVWPKE